MNAKLSSNTVYVMVLITAFNIVIFAATVLAGTPARAVEAGAAANLPEGARALAYQSVITPSTEPPTDVTPQSSVALAPAPDDNAPTGRSPQNPQLTLSYYLVAGESLRPRNSSTEYAYDGVGCSHVTVGSSTGRIIDTELHLPENSVIKYLRVYYRDTNAANGVEGYITRYQPGVGTADLVHTGSTDVFVGGYGFTVSTEITETVNNTIYAYTLIGWPDDANVNNQICGLRVAYYAPSVPFGTFMPLINR